MTQKEQQDTREQQITALSDTLGPALWGSEDIWALYKGIDGRGQDLRYAHTVEAAAALLDGPVARITADAERRGAVKALRSAGALLRFNEAYGAAAVVLTRSAEVQNGGDL